MTVSIVVGAQFGGEGKGKAVSNLCREQQSGIVVRCGGPNSGHTTTSKGEITVLRQLPVCIFHEGWHSAISPGSIIDVDVILDEIKEHGVSPHDLSIHPTAIVITDADRDEERDVELRDRIGSTGTGTGAAVTRRAMRGPDIFRAKDIPELEPYIQDVFQLVQDGVDVGTNIIVEGTQGFGLSLYHGYEHPFTTSRDTTASAFASEVGLSPRSIDDVVLVVRTHPIRVGGHSGPLPHETTWGAIRESSGYKGPIGELTTVTKTLRRVGTIDWGLIEQAVKANRPTRVMINGLDYLDFTVRSSKEPHHSSQVHSFLKQLVAVTGAPLDWMGIGPHDHDVVTRCVEVLA